MNDLSSNDIKRMVKFLKKKAIPPGEIKTQAEADRATLMSEALGIDNEWKIGDRYYSVGMNMEVY